MSITSTSVLFDRLKKLKIPQPDLDNNISILKINKKNLKSVLVFDKYSKIF